MQFIKSAHFVLFLLVNVMALLDLDFISDNQIFFLFLLVNGLSFLSL